MIILFILHSLVHHVLLKGGSQNQKRKRTTDLIQNSRAQIVVESHQCLLRLLEELAAEKVHETADRHLTDHPVQDMQVPRPQREQEIGIDPRLQKLKMNTKVFSPKKAEVRRRQLQ